MGIEPEVENLGDGVAYDKINIEEGIIYCDWLRELKLKSDPHYGFNIADFKNWLTNKLQN